jgi:hypothetical protein
MKLTFKAGEPRTPWRYTGSTPEQGDINQIVGEAINIPAGQTVSIYLTNTGAVDGNPIFTHITEVLHQGSEDAEVEIISNKQLNMTISSGQPGVIDFRAEGVLS